jgi:glycosyltransferase involved in cell wall biosynthesis
MKRILFIGHDASRSGAPIVLLQLLRWLKNNKASFEVDLMLLSGGELEKDYRKVANVYVSPQQEGQGIVRRLIARLNGSIPRSGPWVPYYKNYDTVVGNTAVTLEHVKYFKQRGVRTISWLHELDYAISVLIGKDRFVELANFVDEFVVGSRAVEGMLKRFGINNRTFLAYDFWERDESVPEDDRPVREELGIPRDSFVVVGSGRMEWRKGVDLFLQIASRVTSKCSDVFFIWVGGSVKDSDKEYIQMRHDQKGFDLEGKVFFVGTHQILYNFFSTMDVFALTSREDPFPLVCLEAASLGKPIICFEKSGGMPEFVEEDAGIVVPYGDVNAFSDSILFYHGNRVELERAGKAAKGKFASRFSLELSCKKINEILSNS